ncbi:hypothetical protein WDZ17_14205 [Pseudokineococcus basanitobsidens]|uniref:Uncharacterized protein n=1 Tax=Pseudokineococcus basanitobsidens TaxID=1926649 RepID=A0ABU8RN24_9ACTN
MQIPKQQVIDFIKSKMGGDKAQQADQEMPEQVDTEKDSGLLQKFGVDPKELMGGGGGGIGSKLGL